MNFIGSKHPLADLIIFRDLKVIHSSAKASPVGNWNGEDYFPVVCISRENGGEDLVRPVFIKKENSGGLRELI